MADDMTAMQAPALNAPLQAARAPVPAPGPDQVQIAVKACGLNFADTLVLKGSYQEKIAPPITPGMEVAGVVSALGAGVSEFAIGDRVSAMVGFGGLAERAVAPAAGAIRLPDAVDFVTAAAATVAYGTSHLALARRARLQPGERLLVLGAAGGVGLTAVEIGKLMGAEVIAVARGAEKRALARDKGADHAIDADDADLTAAVKALGGADVVYDPVGGPLWAAAIRAANFEGRLLPIGFASGEIPQIAANYLLVKNIEVIGLYWGAYLQRAPTVLAESLRTLMGWIAEGRLVPHVSDRLPLAEAEAALDLLRTRKAMGKVVVEI